uniref:Uncharacterized protein n=1 Tax=Ascaris lumbricoides TaxID=6252 RepID=A0A0M3IMH1_ASCLU
MLVGINRPGWSDLQTFACDFSLLACIFIYYGRVRARNQRDRSIIFY